MKRFGRIAVVLAAAALAAGLAGCGKKGRLEPPEGAASQFPRFYPKPERLPVPPGQAPQAPQPTPPEDNRIQAEPPMQNRILPP